MIDKNRRGLMLGLPIGLVGASLLQGASASDADATQSSAAPVNPRETLHALAKVLGAIDGSRAYNWLSGRIFSKQNAVPLAEPILDWEGCTIRRFAFESPDRLRMTYRGIILFKAVDGPVIDEFASPVSGKPNAVKHFRTAIGTYVFTSTGIEPSARFKGRLGVNPNPFVLPWAVAGDDVWMTLDERVEYTRPSTTLLVADNAIFRYQSRLSEIQDKHTSAASANISYHSEIGYYDWMGMMGVEGHTIWGAAGKKYAKLSELPSNFVDEVVRRYPTHFSDPL